MGVSRITVLMLQGNDVQVVDTADRTEAWILHAGKPHALMLSCPHDKRPELEQFIAGVKAEAAEAAEEA